MQISVSEEAVAKAASFLYHVKWDFKLGTVLLWYFVVNICEAHI